MNLLLVTLLKGEAEEVCEMLFNNLVCKKKRKWCNLQSGFENHFIVMFAAEILQEYQPSGSPPATPHRLQHLTAYFIQNEWWGLEIGQTLGYWTPEKLSLNKFANLKNPKMLPGATK